MHVGGPQKLVQVARLGSWRRQTCVAGSVGLAQVVRLAAWRTRTLAGGLPDALVAWGEIVED